MQRFEFQTPDGRKFEVEAPDAQSAIAAWQSQDKGRAEPQTGAAEDYAKGVGSGLVEGAEFLGGMSGDVQSLMQAGGNWIGNRAREATGKPALNPEQQAALNESSGLPLPTSQDVAGFQRGITGFQPYEPERAGARYAKMAATFVPAAAAFGAPAGVRSMVASAGKYGVVPGLTSEAGGDVASMAYGEGARPYGQFAGALGGPMAANLGKRAITPFPASASRTDAANYLQNEGVDAITAGQRTGNLRLQYRESQQGGPAGAQRWEQAGEQYTAAALRRAGINSTRATPEIIRQGFDDIGRQFDTLSATNAVQVDMAFANSARDALQTYTRLVSQPNRSPAVLGYFREIANKSARGTIPGDEYVNIRSRIMTDARAVSDAATGRALRDLAHSLDDAMERSIAATNPNDLGAFQEARRLYRNMLVIEHAAGSAGQQTAAGILTPAQLRAGMTNIEGRRSRARGYGDFDGLVRAGEIAMTPLPQSGTAPRLATYGIPTVGAISGAGAGFQAGGGTENLQGGIPGAMLGFLMGRSVPAAISGGMMSRPGQAYLANQLLSRTIADPRSAAMSTLLNSSIPLRQPALPPPR